MNRRIKDMLVLADEVHMTPRQVRIALIQAEQTSFIEKCPELFQLIQAIHSMELFDRISPALRISFKMKKYLGQLSRSDKSVADFDCGPSPSELEELL